LQNKTFFQIVHILLSDLARLDCHTTRAKMALGSVLYFTVGGLFTGIYVNAVRQMPWFRSEF
jgi:hypothetical protein